jgi:hypothetical protein
MACHLLKRQLPVAVGVGVLMLRIEIVQADEVGKSHATTRFPMHLEMIEEIRHLDDFPQSLTHCQDLKGQYVSQKTIHRVNLTILPS